MPNRLEKEKSPYLLQHAGNPVDWFPWGPEAFERARNADKPLLVSIGYSACHWCHVMAHESFEDPAVAALMNENFINVKVDREERPDVDAIHMEAVQALTGQGGWPLNAFVTPDGKPFFAGTYFPPERRHGLPSWRDVVSGVASAYRERREEVVAQASGLVEHIRKASQADLASGTLTPRDLHDAGGNLLRAADWVNGGFGAAPKFPQPLALDFLLQLHLASGLAEPLEFALLTLQRMASGGIFDQLGGGFHRYSVDSTWLVPHFEKMLYDNALLARVYLHAFQITGRHLFRQIAERTIDYVLRDLRSREGAFFSSEDADSEGVEGKYYVWDLDQIAAVIGPENAALFAQAYGVTRQGNFEGHNVLTFAGNGGDGDLQEARDGDLPESDLARMRDKLLRAREDRVRPAKDLKIIASWNGLAIRALSEVGLGLDRPDYIEAAERAARFILQEMVREGQVVRSYNEGVGHIRGFLEDYAYLAEAFISLYESTSNSEYFGAARDLLQQARRNFWDEASSAFFDAASDGDLVVRPRGLFDNPIPSGNASAAMALLRLAALDNDEDLAELAASVVEGVAGALSRAPSAFGYMLQSALFLLSNPLQVAVVEGESKSETKALLREVSRRYLPTSVLARGSSGSVGLLDGKHPIEGRATAYVCQNFTCRQPVASAQELSSQLDQLMAPWVLAG